MSNQRSLLVSASCGWHIVVWTPVLWLCWSKSDVHRDICNRRWHLSQELPSIQQFSASTWRGGGEKAQFKYNLRFSFHLVKIWHRFYPFPSSKLNHSKWHGIYLASDPQELISGSHIQVAPIHKSARHFNKTALIPITYPARSLIATSHPTISIWNKTGMKLKL